MPAQRTMNFAAAAFLLLLIADGRVMGMGDPRAPTDGAPLKREGCVSPLNCREAALQLPETLH